MGKTERVEHLSDYLIDKILPAGETHLLAGPTGAGKTRWLFQMLLQWQAGLPVLGHRSHPVPWVYIAADRSISAAKRTLDDMQIDMKQINCIPAWDRQMTLGQITDAIKAENAQLAVFEAFGSFCDPPANSRNVKNFLSAHYKAMQHEGITTIGVMESPKMKPKDRYDNPRQRVSGVATWGHFTETIFLMEPSNAGDPSDPARTLYCCPRNGPGHVVPCQILPPHGTFVMLPEGSMAEKDFEDSTSHR
jgi:hypothetical protein